MKFSALLDLVFPPRCVNCAKHLSGQKAVCGPCLGLVSLKTAFLCQKCGGRLPLMRKICHPEFPYLLGAAADYDNEVVKKLIHSLKFLSIKDSAEPLAELLIRYFKEAAPGGSPKKTINRTVVPIPLSARRKRERGFNQAELIAARFAEHFNLPLELNLLERIRHSQPQTDLTFDKRHSNVAGCFAVNQNLMPQKGGFILIDDVTTSGATFLEAARVLRASGGKNILALAVARA